MKRWLRVLTLSTSAIVLASVGQAQTASRQAQTTPMLSDQAFKNVQALKGIPVDDFMGTMGFMSASLGFDCSECHQNAGTDKVDWAADTPRKIIARRMVQMVTAINKQNFGGVQKVTCWTCHRNRDHPITTPTFDIIYGDVTQQPDDVLTAVKGKTADQILDRYINAVGGAQKLAGLTSFVGIGRSVGFGGFGGGGHVTLYTKNPDQRTLVIEYPDAPGRGDTTRSYDGKVGWLRTPLNVLAEYQLSGSELDGAKLDAEMGFPGQLKQALTDLKVGASTSISDLPGPSSQTSLQGSNTSVGTDRSVDVVQGMGPRGLLTTLYFAQDNGLLLRMIRYGNSPIGHIPTQIDFGDYRDVGNGIKLPFSLTFAWVDGRDAIQLSEIKTNVSIDEAKFGRPPSLKK